MKLTKCPNSHFYDADKYEECPHCSIKSGIVKKTDAKEQVKVPTAKQSAVPLVQTQQTSGNGMTVSFKQAVNRSGFELQQQTEPSQTDSKQTAEIKPKAESVDEALHAFAKIGSSIFRKQPQEKHSETISTPQSVAKTESPSLERVAPSVQKSTVPSAPQLSQSTVGSTPKQQQLATSAQPQAGGLAQAVAAAKAQPVADDGRTVAYYQFADAEPVVGWLIGLSGFYFGESFNLKAGHNFIGRSLSMDVALVEEKSVSREYHANVIFDPKSRRFFIQPGRGNGLTYLNDELLLTPAELHIYNKIQLGDHTYIFMPFCGRNFSWDDYTNED